MNTSTLDDVLSYGEVLITVTKFIDSLSALNLSRVSFTCYGSLGRNSPMAITIWRMYLTDSRYVTNRLVFDIGRSLVDTSDVSRANFKLLVAVLSQKSGFMKINKLKALCAAGKLKTPLLPKKGQWRELVRLDPFALKRATTEGYHANQAESVSSRITSGPSMESLIIRLAGSRSKSPLLQSQLTRLIQPFTETAQSAFSSICTQLCVNNQSAGLVDLLVLTSKSIVSEKDKPTFHRIIETAIVPFRTIIGDNILHAMIRSNDLECCRHLVEFDAIKPLLNEVNLNHETPLLLAHKTFSKSNETSNFLSFLISVGANPAIPDKKGNLYNSN